MANQRDIVLRAGNGTPKDVVLRALPIPDVPSTTIYLYALDATPSHVVLRSPTAAPSGGAFPTQYQGLRIWHSGAMVELCLVATADGATGMGGQPRIRKGGVTYAIYLVETTDPNASPVRLRTSAGTKSIRLKT